MLLYAAANDEGWDSDSVLEKNHSIVSPWVACLRELSWKPGGKDWGLIRLSSKLAPGIHGSQSYGSISCRCYLVADIHYSVRPIVVASPYWTTTTTTTFLCGHYSLNNTIQQNSNSKLHRYYTWFEMTKWTVDRHSLCANSVWFQRRDCITCRG